MIIFNAECWTIIIRKHRKTIKNNGQQWKQGQGNGKQKEDHKKQHWYIDIQFIPKDLEKPKVNIKGTQNKLKSHTNLHTHTHTSTDTENKRDGYYLKIDATNPFHCFFALRAKSVGREKITIAEPNINQYRFLNALFSVLSFIFTISFDNYWRVEPEQNNSSKLCSNFQYMVLIDISWPGS